MSRAKKNEGLLYDVGMHMGEDTDYYLKKGFKVIAFEANPALLEHCKKRFSNEIAKGKLTIVEGAIVDPLRTGSGTNSIKFYRNKELSVWGTVADDWARRNVDVFGATSEIIEVPVVNFAQCLETYGIPHYMKIDIEGMDSVCLKALLPFEQKPDYISIESEKVSFRKLLEELDLLTQLGYTKFKAVEQCYIARQQEPNPSKEGLYLGYQFQPGSSGLFGKDLPGRWKNCRRIASEYRSIFLVYKLFGDYGTFKRFNRYLTGGWRGKLFSMVFFGKTLPCWYDMHAEHQSVVS